MWKKAQKWETGWWGNCINTYGEEYKQLLYAEKMGLKTFHDDKSPFNIDMKGKSVLDIGGGPVSLLLKCYNVIGTVADPLPVPQWVKDRYKLANINFVSCKGENVDKLKESFDEVWIYNVLQHTEDPKKIINNALKMGKILRLFEWVDIGTNEGHPHNLTKEKLDEWLGGEGIKEYLNGKNTCTGNCYYGIFTLKGDGRP